MNRAQSANGNCGIYMVHSEVNSFLDGLCPAPFHLPDTPPPLHPHLEAARELVGLEVGGRVLVTGQGLQDGADLGGGERQGRMRQGRDEAGAGQGPDR